MTELTALVLLASILFALWLWVKDQQDGGPDAPA